MRTWIVLAVVLVGCGAEDAERGMGTAGTGGGRPAAIAGMGFGCEGETPNLLDPEACGSYDERLTCGLDSAVCVLRCEQDSDCPTGWYCEEERFFSRNDSPTCVAETCADECPAALCETCEPPACYYEQCLVIAAPPGAPE